MILVSNVAPAFWMWCAEKIMVSLMHSIHISWEQQYYDRGQDLYCLCIACYFYPSHTALSDAPSLLGPSTGSELPETNGNPFQPFINRYPVLRFFCLLDLHRHGYNFRYRFTVLLRMTLSSTPSASTSQFTLNISF